jgi:hypothetical protein
MMQTMRAAIAGFAEAVKRAVRLRAGRNSSRNIWRKPVSRTLGVTDCGHVFHCAILLAYEELPLPQPPHAARCADLSTLPKADGRAVWRTLRLAPH